MNGYSYNGAYDADGMDQGDQYGNQDSMMMGQDGLGNGMIGGQSLDEIVNQNAKAMRRQSIPPQYGTGMNNVDTNLRQISMMDYGAGSPATSVNNFGFDTNTGIDRGGMLPGASPSHVSQLQRRGTQSQIQSRRQSGEHLALSTNFTSGTPGYGSLMPSTSAYSAPAIPQSVMDLSMTSPYIDSSMGMSMDNLGAGIGDEAMNMNLYSQPQFSTSMMNSPMQANPQHDTSASVTMGPVQDSGGGGSMNMSQYDRHGSASGASTVRALSRSHDFQTPETTSPAHNGTPQHANTQLPQDNHSGHARGFPAQIQHPEPGSEQDRGMDNGITNTRNFDGINGPTAFKLGTYNPNNQGFAWETPEGGWPSTMVGKPHMNSAYKNAYSSTGFDMLGVLVCFNPPPFVPYHNTD